MGEKVELLKDHSHFLTVEIKVGIFIGEVVIFKENTTARRNFEHIEAAQEGGFTRAGCADDANYVALEDINADAL
jgi:hypothetical protein